MDSTLHAYAFARRRRLAIPARVFFLCLLCLYLPSVALGVCGAECQEVRQMFQECVSSGGRAASTYSDWLAQNGCICPGSSTGSGQRTCSASATGSAAAGGSSGDLVHDSSKAIVQGIMNNNGQEVGVGMMGIGAAMLIQGIQGDPAAEAARRQREAEAAAERARIEAERSRQFEAGKSSLLEQTDGNNGITVSATADDNAAQWNWLMRMHQREMDLRQAALARLHGSPDENWCKLNLVHVRLPTPPLNDVGNQYPAMVDRYLAARNEWDSRCGGPSAASGYQDNDRQLLALKPPAAAATPVQTAAATPPTAVASDASVVDLSTVAPHAVVQSPGSGAPPVPAAWGTPEEVHLMLSGSTPPVIAGAATYIGSATQFLARQAQSAGQDALSDAAAAQLGLTGTVLLNATKLPALILPQVGAAARGDLGVTDADRLLPQAVNTLYNVGTVAGTTSGRPDVADGVAVWSATKATDAAGAEITKQVGSVNDLSPTASLGELLSNAGGNAAGRWVAGNGVAP